METLDVGGEVGPSCTPRQVQPRCPSKVLPHQPANETFSGSGSMAQPASCSDLARGGLIQRPFVSLGRCAQRRAWRAGGGFRCLRRADLLGVPLQIVGPLCWGATGGRCRAGGRCIFRAPPRAHVPLAKNGTPQETHRSSGTNRLGSEMRVERGGRRLTCGACSAMSNSLRSCSLARSHRREGTTVGGAIMMAGDVPGRQGWALLEFIPPCAGSRRKCRFPRRTVEIRTILIKTWLNLYPRCGPLQIANKCRGNDASGTEVNLLATGGSLRQRTIGRKDGRQGEEEGRRGGASQQRGRPTCLPPPFF